MLAVLQAAPADIRVVRAVEPNLDSVRALCADKGIALSADYADAETDMQTYRDPKSTGGNLYSLNNLLPQGVASAPATVVYSR